MSTIEQPQTPAFPRDATPVEDGALTLPRVSPLLTDQLVALREQLAVEGALLKPEEASQFRARFHDRFGPAALSGLDGEPLLVRMHGRGKNKESLVYWLEFKDDEDFAAPRFGSIGGGSALKFGIYQSAESGVWMAGSANQQVRLPLDEAIAKARSQRDQLVAAARILESAGPAESIDYGALQKRLEQAAPDVAETSWGHKYLTLLFPDRLEPIHGIDYQRHQLRKLLKLPADGRYANARIFAGVARQLGMSLLDLGVVLHRRNGPPHLYWRAGTTIDDRRFWPEMRDGGYVAVGWEALGDLSGIEHTKQGKEAVRALMATHYPAAENVVSRQAGQCFQFVRGMQERDIVVAMEGHTVKGVGRVAGPYEHVQAGGPMPHRHRVEWLLIDDWKLLDVEGHLTTFVQLQKSQRNLIEIESRLLGQRKPSGPAIAAPTIAAPPPSTTSSPTGNAVSLTPLTGLVARVESILQRKRQVILYGPPGTGKTYWAERAANELAARAWFGVTAEKLTEAQRSELKTHAVEMCSFHPAYGYEDFIEGFRPVRASGAVGFELRDGIFKRTCERARRDAAHPYFLIIDEINRGDIPRIFGELLTIMEKEKRGTRVSLPLSGQPFSVPENVHILGTMNTADRSIALLDTALRRRFGFVELLPDKTVLGTAAAGRIPLGAWLEELNKRVLEHAGRDARNLQIGHSYLMPDGVPLRELPRFAEVLRDDILPLLEEYCYEDFDALERILGATLVNKKDKRIAHQLFDPDRQDELVDALLSSFDQITATQAAVEADGGEDLADDEEPPANEGPGA